MIRRSRVRSVYFLKSLGLSEPSDKDIIDSIPKQKNANSVGRCTMAQLIPFSEAAAVLFAGISAVTSSIQVWRLTRNQYRAAEEFDSTFEQAQHSPETLEAAEELAQLVESNPIAPPNVIEDLESRADSCWTGCRNILGGNYLPDEIDQATVSVRHCVCRELRRIYDLNGGVIPARWRGQWDAYECAYL